MNPWCDRTFVASAELLWIDLNWVILHKRHLLNALNSFVERNKYAFWFGRMSMELLFHKTPLISRYFWICSIRIVWPRSGNVTEDVFSLLRRWSGNSYNKNREKYEKRARRLKRESHDSLRIFEWGSRRSRRRKNEKDKEANGCEILLS